MQVHLDRVELGEPPPYRLRGGLVVAVDGLTQLEHRRAPVGLERGLCVTHALNLGRRRGAHE